MRTAGLQFIMITLAFAQMVFFLFVSLKYYGGDDGLIVRRRDVLFNLDMADDTTFYFVCLAVAAVYFFLFWRLAESRFGLVLGGIRQNERRLAAIGISTYRYKLVAFVIAGAGAGFAGALMANFAKFVSPDMLHWSQSGELMIMVILGGGATLFGPLIGAAMLIGLETVLTGWTEHWQVFLGPFLILIALFTPGGVLSLSERVRAAPMAEPLLRIDNLTKRFGSLAASDGLSLDVIAGEVHARDRPERRRQNDADFPALRRARSAMPAQSCSPARTSARSPRPNGFTPAWRARFRSPSFCSNIPRSTM